ncbi:MAG: polysulfide reductase NrfD [Chloroflexi bacterium]|nr:polysulfide reductase NrfD [Chloroflexota bacterium]
MAVVALSGGAFTLAALVYVLQLERLHAAVRPTVLAGLLGYSSVLLILLFDLGRWDKFYNVFLRPNFSLGAARSELVYRGIFDHPDL